MNKKKQWTTSLAAAALAGGLPFTAVAADEISHDSVLASTCFTCHGTTGGGANSMPSIVGWPEDTMVETLQAFRTGERRATIMDRHARGYTDDELRAIARFLAQLQQ
ncbi:c-type cytochrome [Ectothiorhodospiraceae bacterium 2226]|nr:c-type cytochrome [Ectothiorhodospiraceae bacterium 2226]